MEAFDSYETHWWQRHTEHVAAGEHVRFDLFVRTLGAPIGAHQRQASILDRIDRLADGDVVDAANVDVWGDAVCVSECCTGRRAIDSVYDRIESFRDWGRDKPTVSLGFDRRRVDCSFTDETFDVVELPTVCLAAYVDSRLECVVPLTVDGQQAGIEGYLDWFERTRTDAGRRQIVDV